MMSHRHSFLLAGTVALALVAASGALAADGPPGQGREEHWAKVDTDGDGAISKAEAEAGAPRIARDFANLDADEDGRITREEMHAQMQARHAATREERRARAEERYRSADTNGDGALDLAEAQQGMPRMAEHFAEIDADADGLVTREELQAAMLARRAERMREGGGGHGPGWGPPGE
jgi:hypothetical protein